MRVSCSQIAEAAKLKAGRRTAKEHLFICPRHDDHSPTLSLNPEKDVFHCPACNAGGNWWKFAAFLAAVDLEDKKAVSAWLQAHGLGNDTNEASRGKIVATYRYVDEQSQLLFETVRYAPKTFKQRRPDGTGGWTWNLENTRRILYRLPELLRAVDSFIVEGEKDADNLNSLGLTATCNPGGAGKWRPEYIEAFRPDQHIAIIPDNDEAGRKHARQIAESLFGKVASLKILALPGLPEKGDVSDWLIGRDTETAAEELARLAEAAPAWTPDDCAMSYSAAREKLGLVSMVSVTPEAVQWLWRPRIPIGKVTLIDGDPGLGKSFITLAIATAESNGCGLPGEPPRAPGRVILASAEDGVADTIRPRLDPMGADCSMITAITKALTLNNGGIDDLDSIFAIDRPRLMVLDPLFAYTGSKLDIHRANETRAVMSQLSALAAKHKCAILCVRHLTKGSRDKSIYRGVGSIDLTAACRSVLLVGADGNDRSRRAIVQIKNNLAPLADPIGYSLVDGVFSWTGLSDLTADVILASEDAANDALPVDEAVEFLSELLSRGPTSQTDVKTAAKKAGVSERTLYRAKKKLGVHSHKTGFGDSWAWSVNGNGRAQ